MLARAPGRLDFIGGVSDYSGGVVLEATLAHSAYVVAQRTEDDWIEVRTTLPAAEPFNPEARFSRQALFPQSGLLSLDEAAALFQQDPATHWAAYILGCLMALAESGRLQGDRVGGLSLLVSSEVPAGAGVSSSAALEVAAMRAIAHLYRVPMDGLSLARLCQTVENRVVGAPCGIMDQVTSALGRQDALIELRCQPHDVLGFIPIPDEWQILAINSAVKHSVGGSSYRRARVAAYMGFRIAQLLLSDNLNGYLCNLGPDRLAAIYDELPETLSGREFLTKYGELPDATTSVDTDEIYRVRACASHPIKEDQRVLKMASILQAAGEHPTAELGREAGELMHAAHRAYNELELGSPETDLLVELAQKEGAEAGIYGAKITGGGSGGAVALLVNRAEEDGALDRICTEYHRQTGLKPERLDGSSEGAMFTPVETIPI